MFETLLNSDGSSLSTGDIWSQFEKESLADENLDFDLDDFLAQHECNQDFKIDQTDQYLKKVSQINVGTT